MIDNEMLIEFLRVENWNTIPIFRQESFTWTSNDFFFGKCHVFLFKPLKYSTTQFPILFTQPNLISYTAEYLRKNYLNDNYLLFPFLKIIIGQEGIYFVWHCSITEQIETTWNGCNIKSMNKPMMCFEPNKKNDKGRLFEEFVN
jgi:hypothetical protein